MKDHYILVSESNVGIHRRESTEQEVYISIPLIFPINASRGENGKYMVVASSSGEIKEEEKKPLRKKYDQIVKLFKEAKRSQEYRDSIILMAHDDDPQGHLMSLATRKALVELGIPKTNLVRMPLTEWGYLGFTSFIEEKNIQGYLEAISREKSIIASQKGKLSKPVGITKQVSLKYTYLFKDKKIEGLFDLEHIDSKGTSTATVLVKFMEE